MSFQGLLKFAICPTSRHDEPACQAKFETEIAAG
jgi:hypothetical protein